MLKNSLKKLKKKGILIQCWRDQLDVLLYFFSMNLNIKDKYGKYSIYQSSFQVLQLPFFISGDGKSTANIMLFVIDILILLLCVASLILCCRAILRGYLLKLVTFAVFNKKSRILYNEFHPSVRFMYPYIKLIMMFLMISQLFIWHIAEK